MTQHDGSRLLEPFELGALSLRNRVVMAPMTRLRANGAGLPASHTCDYYRQRASAGLIISEATNISAQAVGAPGAPGIWTDAQVGAWLGVTDAVHAEGGKIVLQLWHTGRVSHNDLQPDGAPPVAPSAIKPDGFAFTPTGMKEHPTPRALETDEIPGIVEDYRQAAQSAKAAGFDGVEIHSANNYLIEQFIRDSTNRRTDAYGGSIENRLRFPLAVARAVTAVWGPGRVGVRISPTTDYTGAAPDSDVMGTYGTYIDALDKLGLAYLHGIEGVPFVTRAYQDIDFTALRRRFRGPYIANNCFGQADAEAALQAGDADLVSFARLYIANPDLVERFRRGGPLVEAPKESWYGGGNDGYSDWPTLPQEACA